MKLIPGLYAPYGELGGQRPNHLQRTSGGRTRELRCWLEGRLRRKEVVLKVSD